MIDRKESFVLHLDMLEDVKEMTMTEKAEFLDFVINYNMGEFDIDQVSNGATKRFYRLFAKQFDRDHDKWLKTKEKRRAAGKKGGLAKASKSSKCYDNLANASDAKHNTNVNANTNVNINADVNENEDDPYDPFGGAADHLKEMADQRNFG
jgi:hypothetical protein